MGEFKRLRVEWIEARDQVMAICHELDKRTDSRDLVQHMADAIKPMTVFAASVEQCHALLEADPSFVVPAIVISSVEGYTAILRANLLLLRTEIDSHSPDAKFVVDPSDHDR